MIGGLDILAAGEAMGKQGMRERPALGGDIPTGGKFQVVPIGDADTALLHVIFSWFFRCYVK